MRNFFILSIATAFILACSSESKDENEEETLPSSSSYKQITIGSQTWMAENLNIDAEGSACYLYDEFFCELYGRLYNWETAMEVCPSGWHLPSNEEWEKLYRYVDGDNSTESPYYSLTAGKYLKAASGWSSKGNGAEPVGFAALPGGHADSSGNFTFIGNNGLWWSSSEHKDNSSQAYLQVMVYEDDAAWWDTNDKGLLLSVRCVED